MWLNGSAGLEVFPQGDGSTQDTAQVVVFNNTSYNNWQDSQNPGGGELMFNQIYPILAQTGRYSITNNIFLATLTASGRSGGRVWGAAIDCRGNNTCLANVIAISGNYIWDNEDATPAMGGNNTTAFYSGAGQGSNWPWGSNTYSDPEMTAPSSLPSTAPDCSGYSNVTTCMNRKYNVSNNVAPGRSAVGIGYTAPGHCAPDAYFPTWLKGVVYVCWSPATGTFDYNPNVLINQPCGL
jgi:hypothetical protein